MRKFWNERVLEFWLRRHKHFQTKLLSTEAKKNILADIARALIMNVMQSNVTLLLNIHQPTIQALQS